MNLENKSLVFGLLNALRKINSARGDIDYTKKYSLFNHR